MTTRRRLAGLNLAKVQKTARMSPLGGGTVARFITEMSFDWVETASGYSCSAIDGLAGGQDGCTSIGYSESCSQEPRKRILFGQLPFGYSFWPGFEYRLTRFSVPLHLKPLPQVDSFRLYSYDIQQQEGLCQTLQEHGFL